MIASIALLAMIPSSLCIGFAGYLAVHNQGGWGWFLVVGLLLGAFRYTENGKGEG